MIQVSRLTVVISPGLTIQHLSFLLVLGTFDIILYPDLSTIWGLEGSIFSLPPND